MNSSMTLQLLLIASMASAVISTMPKTVLRGSITSNLSSETAREQRIPTTIQEQGEHHQQQQTNEDERSTNNYHRRHLVESLTCKLYLKDVEYEPTPKHPLGYSEEEWFCELPPDESSRLGVRFVSINNAMTYIPPKTISGSSSLTISEGIVDNREDATLFIPDDALVDLETEERDEKALVELRKRGLEGELETKSYGEPSSTGKLSALVIRVIDSRNLAPDISLDQLRQKFFNDDVNLSSQYKACSHGKLKIEPFEGVTEAGQRVISGAVDVNIDYDIVYEGDDRGSGKIQEAALGAATQQLGSLFSDDFDLVMFVFPPGTGNWMAYAFVNSKYSFYNNQWASSVSVQMHEVGHSLGLAHSGEEGQGAYQDQTGMMGFSYNIDDQRMCFNPAKNYQLGWYEDQSKSIDPLNNKNNEGIRKFTLNGVSDYKKNPNALVTLRLVQTDVDNQDYYIGYNRKDGINRETAENGDMITIVRKDNGAPDEYGESNKMAALHLGQSHTLRNYNGGQGRDVEIRFVGLLADTGDATVEIVDVANAFSSVSYEDGPCSEYTFEVTTDEFPEDIYWTIIEDGAIGRIHAQSPLYTEKNTKTVTTICLPDRSDNVGYKFVISDKYGDGMCCQQGEGSYRGFDPDGNLMFEGGENFSLMEHRFSAVHRSGITHEDVIQSYDDDYVDDNFNNDRKVKCRNRKRKKFKWKDTNEKPNRKIKLPKKSCKWIASQGKCDDLYKGRPLWRRCRKSCNKCKK